MSHYRCFCQQYFIFLDRDNLWTDMQPLKINRSFSRAALYGLNCRWNLSWNINPMSIEDGPQTNCDRHIFSEENRIMYRSCCQKLCIWQNRFVTCEIFQTFFDTHFSDVFNCFDFRRSVRSIGTRKLISTLRNECEMQGFDTRLYKLTRGQPYVGQPLIEIYTKFAKRGYHLAL